ncbi:hypothetical protein NEHOM01_1541 [Nematocida homosporus]|uniref:uncharacterized protein n=1 Tax=Nematocida homosporus TaxID=1912981 RepID=UPI002220D733|nr:uncharacterized protein NEHOM01_1541 [Nematocida homosporus]KAI5186555.1 hypothetical protein NEHOM01_1541 [Nematocida homosporus]
MNRRLNRYSLNVYQVVFLVIGLCCVWCNTVKNSDKMRWPNRFKRSRVNRDNRTKLVYAGMTNAIDELGILSENQLTRIDVIKQGQQSFKEEKHAASENMNSTQSDCSFSDKSKDIFEQEKIDSISQLVRKEIIRQRLNILAQQMEHWTKESRNAQAQSGSQMESIDMLVNTTQQLSKIKRDLKNSRNQSPDSQRSIFENGLITIGARCNSHGLTSRIKVIVIEELTKILPKIDTLDRVYLTKIIDPVINQLLKPDELRSPDNVSRIIKETLAQLDNRFKEMEVESESEQEPTDLEPSNSRTRLSNPQTNGSGMVEEELVQLDNKFKEMEVESESEQEPTDPEPSTSRTRLSNPQANGSDMVEEELVQLDNRFKEMEVESESEQEPTGSEPSTSRTKSSNPQTNESGVDGKLHSSSKPAGQDSTLSFNGYGFKLPELDQKDCTLKLGSEQEMLLRKFISSSNKSISKPIPVWRVFNINEDNQSRKYGLSSTSLQAKDMFSLNLDWEESELMKLLGILKKFSKIIFNAEKVWLETPYNSAALLVLAQLLTLFESSGLSAMKKPLEVLILLPYRTCPSLESSFNDVKKREQFRNQIEKIEESRYIISMDIYGLTSNVQKFIWPLATHLSISKIDIYRPQLNKIDFLDDVNWIDRFSLKLCLDYQKGLTISLGARTTKGKDLPTCECLAIDTNLPDQDQPSNSPTKICVTGLTEYLQPNSFDEDGRPLNTLLQVSPDISTSP